MVVTGDPNKIEKKRQTTSLLIPSVGGECLLQSALYLQILLQVAFLQSYSISYDDTPSIIVDRLLYIAVLRCDPMKHGLSAEFK